MGNPTDVKTDRGALDVTLGNNPIYVQDVSPKIWGSKSVKPVNAAVSELDLCPGDTGEVSFTITANLLMEQGNYNVAVGLLDPVTRQSSFTTTRVTVRE